MLRFVSTAILSTMIAAPAFASTPFTATLETPKAERERITAYDAIWICEGDTCQADLNRSTVTVRLCKKVVEEIGAVTAFTSPEGGLTEEELETCNASLN